MVWQGAMGGQQPPKGKVARFQLKVHNMGRIKPCPLQVVIFGQADHDRCGAIFRQIQIAAPMGAIHASLKTTSAATANALSIRDARDPLPREVVLEFTTRVYYSASHSLGGSPAGARQMKFL